LATSSNAQSPSVRNSIGCNFNMIQVTYAKIGDCAPEVTEVVSVSAFASTSLSIPAGYEIIEAVGLSATACRFNVGTDCSVFDLTDVVDCAPLQVSTACDNYTVDLDVANQSVLIHH